MPTRATAEWEPPSSQISGSGICTSGCTSGCGGQLLPDFDAVAVGVGEQEAAQPVVGVTQALHDPDSVGGQVIVEPSCS
jgi:hypothetical protein